MLFVWNQTPDDDEDDDDFFDVSCCGCCCRLRRAFSLSDVDDTMTNYTRAAARLFYAVPSCPPCPAAAAADIFLVALPFKKTLFTLGRRLGLFFFPPLENLGCCCDGERATPDSLQLFVSLQEEEEQLNSDEA